MRIRQATAEYEAWLGKQLKLIAQDLRIKHQAMRSAPFPFLRATYYRWAQIWAEVCAEAAGAPEVLGVGDLHVENFGTWRDIEGRLIWGINDFDEVCRLPYTCDLVRLATSAHLAIHAEHLTVPPGKGCDAILEGYRDGLRSGKPFVLAEHHPALRQMAVERLKQPEAFWEKMNALKTWKGRMPSSAMKAMRRALPGRDLDQRPRKLGPAAIRRAGGLAQRIHRARSQRAGGIGVVLGVAAKTGRENLLSGRAGCGPPLSRSVCILARPLDRAAAGAGLLAHRAFIATQEARLFPAAARHGIRDRERSPGVRRAAGDRGRPEAAPPRMAACDGQNHGGVGRGGLEGVAEATPLAC